MVIKTNYIIDITSQNYTTKKSNKIILDNIG